jgi:hypothetical protein
MRPTARGSSRESKLHGTLRAARALLDPLERPGPAPPPMPPARPAGPSPAPMQAEPAASGKVNPSACSTGCIRRPSAPLRSVPPALRWRRPERAQGPRITAIRRSRARRHRRACHLRDALAGAVRRLRGRRRSRPSLATPPVFRAESRPSTEPLDQIRASSEVCAYGVTSWLRTA